jgi:hypothetical protein
MTTARASSFAINGQALAYLYHGNEPGRRATANLLTRDEARRIAINNPKRLELQGRPSVGRFSLVYFIHQRLLALNYPTQNLPSITFHLIHSLSRRSARLPPVRREIDGAIACPANRG